MAVPAALPTPDETLSPSFSVPFTATVPRRTLSSAVPVRSRNVSVPPAATDAARFVPTNRAAMTFSRLPAVWTRLLTNSVPPPLLVIV